VTTPRKNWRSLLFVPGDNLVLLQKAGGVGADGLIVDLEDAVPVANKAMARESLANYGARLASSGADLLVRVNAEPALLPHDIAVLPPETRAVLVPKVEKGEDLAAVDDLLARREAALGLAVGSIGAIAIIESPRALFDLPAIAFGQRVIGLALGTEDLSLALGVAPTALSLSVPAQLICLAAAAAGVMALAIPHSIAAFRDQAGWAAAAANARAFGATGGLCVHPSQVKILNEAFSPTPAELAWASRVVHAWNGTDDDDRGVIVIDGRMVDLPVFRRAEALVATGKPGR
jgi:citrate lyase subunit beta/citryl-CoA lyase